MRIHSLPAREAGLLDLTAKRPDKRRLHEKARSADSTSPVSRPSLTMLRLDKTQRRAVSDTVRQLANLVAGALVLGQFVGQRPSSFILLMASVAVWFVLVCVGLWFAAEKPDG
jgi:hypothetical protein